MHMWQPLNSGIRSRSVGFKFSINSVSSAAVAPPMESIRLPKALLASIGVTKNLKAMEASKELGPFQFRTKIVWFNLLGFLAMHLIGVYGIYLAIVKLYTNFEVATIIWTLVMAFTSGEGITLGAHRLWSHKTFKAKLPLQILLLALQTIAGQNCLYIWARDHRQHHKYSDTDADPHNANRGFFFSHIGWLMMKKHPDIMKMGRTIDMSDLEADPLVMFQKKYYKPLYVVLAMIIPVGIPIYFWNEDPIYSFILCFFTRYIILLNVTWSVNSFAHIFGTRPYDKNILPVESNFVAFISFGEGWHNYHHAFPWDYKAGEWGKGFNTTRQIIEFFHWIGWAYDLREASQPVVNGKATRLGDGSHVPNGPPAPTAQLTVDTQSASHLDESPKSQLIESVSNDLLMTPSATAATDILTQRRSARNLSHG